MNGILGGFRLRKIYLSVKMFNRKDTNKNNALKVLGQLVQKVFLVFKKKIFLMCHFHFHNQYRS